MNNDPMPTLPCPDLDEAMRFFIDRLGFRLEMILPADAPRVAVVSGHGATLRLEASAPADAPSASPEGLVLCRMNDAQAWREGRAGMQYRDLLPGRLGGRFIASHIRIPEGGPVPDYVHYHRIRFQMIFCKAGWVRVVYEDQGPPFVLEAGDCVLQPPEIRHRVLEASPGLEVIEIGCPAEHETHVEHALTLPTTRLAPERVFSGQRFVRHRAAETPWQPGPSEGFEHRDTGIAAATAGLASARVLRPQDDKAGTPTRAHAGEFLFLFLLRGSLALEGATAAALSAGDCCTIPRGLSYALRPSADAEILEVALPADLPFSASSPAARS